MKTLIVDDKCEMREMMRTYLQDLTDDIRECCDGENALAAYTEFLPDWVLMDWQMKRMDGLTATRGIRAVYPEAHILFVTQYDDGELRQAAREAGACGFISNDDLLSLRRLLACPTATSNVLIDSGKR